MADTPAAQGGAHKAWPPPEAVGVDSLDKNNSWFASKKQLRFMTESRKQGVSWEDEVQSRREGADFVREMSVVMRMPQHMASVMMTACLFYQRFYLLHNIADPKFSHMLCAISCLFLACKVEECPMDLRHFMGVWYPKKYGVEAYQRVKACERVKGRTDPEMVQFEREKDMILMGERTVMERLGFDLHVSHPHKITSKLIDVIVELAKTQGRDDIIAPDGTKQLRTTAWNSLNDALKTTVCLQYEPTLCAALAVQLSAQFTKTVLPPYVPEDGSSPVPWYMKPGLVVKAQSEDLFKRMVKDFHYQVYKLSDKLEAQRKQGGRPTQSAPAAGGGGGTKRSAPGADRPRESIDGSVIGSSKRPSVSAAAAPGDCGAPAPLKLGAGGASAPGSADRNSDDSITEDSNPAVKRVKTEANGVENGAVAA